MFFTGEMNFHAAKANGRPAPCIQTGSTHETNLKPSPLNPEWIHNGQPIARSLALTGSGDGLFTAGLWECTPGEFKFIYACDEVVHILEGEVTIREPGGEYTLAAGAVAYFPKGLVAEWTVHKHVKKFCVFHSAPQNLCGRIVAKIKRLLRLA